MNISVWEYLRRRTAEAVLAGFHDAFDHLERHDQAQAIHAAAKLLRKRFQEQFDAPGGHRNGAQPTSLPPAANPPAPAVGPAGPVPQPTTGKPAAGSLIPNQPPQRRRPGRPRKEVHG